MRPLVIFVLALALTPAVNARPAPYSCSTTVATLAYPDRTGWHLAATVPAKASVMVIVTGDGAPSNEWTSVRWAYKQGSTGVIDDAYLTTLFTTAGAAIVQLVDVAADGTSTPIASCPLTVT